MNTKIGGWLTLAANFCPNAPTRERGAELVCIAIGGLRWQPSAFLFLLIEVHR